MSKLQRRKSTVYHVVYSNVRNPNAKQIIRKILKKGLLPRAPRVRPKDEKMFRKIFDREKPKSIHPSQNSSIFFWPKLAHTEVAAEIIKTKVGKQALVADAGIFRDVINVDARHTWLRKHHKELKNRAQLVGWTKEMARKYWATAITLEMFEKYYKEYPLYWLRKKDAPVTLPRKIKIPEILYPHKIRPKDLRIVQPKIQKK